MRRRSLLAAAAAMAAVGAALMVPSAAAPEGSAGEASGSAVVSGSVNVTNELGLVYSVDVAVVRTVDGEVSGYYRHRDPNGHFSLVAARCLRLSPGRAIIGGVTVQSSVGQVGTWASLAIDDRGTWGIPQPDAVSSGVQGPNQGPSCPIPFSPAQILGPWDMATSGNITIATLGWPTRGLP